MQSKMKKAKETDGIKEDGSTLFTMSLEEQL
jgi:hypothetical protein